MKYKYTEYSLINDKHREYIVEAEEFDKLECLLREQLKLSEGSVLSYSKMDEEKYNCCWEIPTSFGIMTCRYGKIEIMKK